MGGTIGGVAAGFVMFIIGLTVQDSAEQTYDVVLGEVIESPNNDPAKADSVIITWVEQGNTQGPIEITLHITPTEYARGKQFKLGVSVDFWLGGWQRDLHYLVRGNSDSIHVR